jgi:hypothetical protein
MGPQPPDSFWLRAWTTIIFGEGGAALAGAFLYSDYLAGIENLIVLEFVGYC